MILKGRVLFLYPNSEGYGGVPNCIALLSACLKDAGFETQCFDTTFLKSPSVTMVDRQRVTEGVEDVDLSEKWGRWDPSMPEKIPGLFQSMVRNFHPDLIAVSFVEVNYRYGISLLNDIKDIPVVAGGVFPTLSPELVIGNDCVDIVCIGEGEDALVELAEHVVNGVDYSGIKNLWVKKNGNIIKNNLRPFKDLDSLPFQDWSIFNSGHFYKPYCGRFYKTGFVELSRGCPFNCTYCCVSALKKLYRDHGSFIRERSIDRSIDEICFLRDKYDIEFVFFMDDNFLGMSSRRFDSFCEQYKERVGLPFYIQTRCETIKESYVKKLKEIGVSSIAMGIEHGDEQYRKEYMNRMTSNDVICKGFNIVHKYGIRSSANVMMGLPCETEAIFKETIKLLKKIKPKSHTVGYFQPYRGTDLRDLSVKAGYIPQDHVVDNTIEHMNIPEFKNIEDYYKNFKKYVEGDLDV